jgi:hypothetical protein
MDIPEDTENEQEIQERKKYFTIYVPCYFFTAVCAISCVVILGKPTALLFLQ